MLCIESVAVCALAHQPGMPPFLPDDTENVFKKAMQLTPWGTNNDNSFVTSGEGVENPNIVCNEKFDNPILMTRASGIYVATLGSNGYFISDVVPAYTIKTFNGYYWYRQQNGDVTGVSSRSDRKRTQWVFSGDSEGLNIWSVSSATNSVLMVPGTSFGTVGGMYKAESASLAYKYDAMYDSTGDFFRRHGYSNLYLGLNSSAGYIANVSSKNYNTYVYLDKEEDYDCPKSISADSSSKTINVGGYVDYNLNLHSLWIYDISNESVISFSQTSTGFRITGLALGTSTFTLMNRFSGATLSVNFTVKPSPVPVTSVSLDKSLQSVVRKTSNVTFTLTPTVYPSNATNKTVSWKSSATSVAGVSTSGVVTCYGPGSATITCTSNSNSSAYATCRVTVVQAVTSITLSSSSLSMKAGQTVAVTSTVYPSNSSNKNVTWSSSNTSVATVSSNGIVTAKSTGSATITCKASDGYGASATCYVSVSNPDPDPVFEYDNIDIVSVTTSNNLTNMKTSGSLTMQCTLKNGNSVGGYIESAIIVVDAENTKIVKKGEIKKAYYSANSSITTTHTMSLSDLEPGNYKVSVMYYDPDENMWYYTGKYLMDMTVKSDDPVSSAYTYAPSTTILKNTKVELPIYMTNSEAVIGFQFDLYLPSGVTVATDSYGDYDISVTSDRTSSSRHVVSAARQTDGAIRVICYSNKNYTFSGSSGRVLNIVLTTTSGASSGTYTGYIKKQIFSSASSTAIEGVDKSFSITVKNYIPGDVNGDGSVTVVDVTSAVSLALGGSSANFIREAADMNNDGTINVVDITSIVNLILNGAKTRSSFGFNNGVDRYACKDDLASRSFMAPAPGSIAVFINDFDIKSGEEKAVPILMNNPGDAFTGVQFDLYLPKGLSLVREFGDAIIDIGSRSSSRRHTVSSATQADGAERIISYSNNNALFSGEDGDILIVYVKADNEFAGGSLSLKNIVLARPNDSEGYKPADYTTKITTGIADVRLEDTATPVFYDLSGRRVDGSQRGVMIQHTPDGKSIKVLKK